MSNLTIDNSEFEDAIATMVNSLSASEQAKVARKIAFNLRTKTKADYRAQRAPDGKKWTPRKIIEGRPNNRGKMFIKLRLNRHFTVRNQPGNVHLGFFPAGRIARIHHQGLRDGDAQYPARPLLGFTRADREMITDTLINHVIGL